MIESIAIISCGPSAKRCRPDAEIMIGCRDRVERHVCDWWVFMDWIVFQRYTPIGKPMAFTSNTVYPSMQNNDPELAERFVQYPKLLSTSGEQPGPIESHPRWNAWSGTAALGLAWKLGMSQVVADGAELHLYGYDLDGESDAAGWTENAKNRSAHRWEAERKLTDEMIALCRGIGWKIKQHGKHKIRH